MPTQNAIGDRGESIFTTRISEFYQFNVYFLGEKAPIVDFLLEVEDTDKPYYFLIQVKSTTKGYHRKTGYIKAVISNSKLLELIKRPLPTYIAGVDVNNEIVYINPAFDTSVSYSSGMPVSHLLDRTKQVVSKATLDLLIQDVKNFWDNLSANGYKTSFHSVL